MTGPGNAGYEIARATGVCAATGRPIAVGDPYVAALVESAEDERLERRDYSLSAWEAGPRPERLFGHWRATMEAPDARRRPYIDDAALMDLFEQLEGAAAPARVSFRYLLALMLIRKRLLKYEGTRRDGESRAMIVRAATPAGATPAMQAEVIDPGMDDRAIAEAIEQLTAVMAGEAPDARA
jgi:hypothetical protein